QAAPVNRHRGQLDIAVRPAPDRPRQGPAQAGGRRHQIVQLQRRNPILMKRLLVSAAIAASILVPTAAAAQALPPAVVAVVDLEKIQATCTACKAASAAFTSQENAIKARQTALDTPLQTEARAIQTAINALPQGAEPDAALTARINAFKQKGEARDTELNSRAQQYQRNRAYVTQ